MNDGVWLPADLADCADFFTINRKKICLVYGAPLLRSAQSAGHLHVRKFSVDFFQSFCFALTNRVYLQDRPYFFTVG